MLQFYIKLVHTKAKFLEELNAELRRVFRRERRVSI